MNLLPYDCTKSTHVIVTGSNSGIGKAAAIKFATEGHRVIMACRNPEKGLKAKTEIEQASGGKTVDLMELDVSSFRSVASFCKAYRERFDRLDILIHNAGYFEHGLKTYQFSTDGLEMSFAANVFGPYLMSELLADLLSQSDDARILFACSTNINNFFDPKRKIEFDNLQGEFKDSRPYATYKMYGDSKMGLLLLTYKMAETYRAKGINVNALMIPATRVSKDTMHKFHSFYKFIGPIIQNLNPWTLEQEDIANCYYAITTDEAFKDITGALIDANLNVIQPAESDGPLPPWKLISELRHTRHTPAYANRADNIATMWNLTQKVLRERGFRS